MFNYYK